MRYIDYAVAPRADHLKSWLREQFATASQIHVRTGFFTSAGVGAILPDLQAHLDAGGTFSLLLGGDPIQWEMGALWEALRLSQEYPGLTDVRMMTRPDFQNAKTYVIKHSDDRKCAWVGSANLTTGGLANNYEAAVTLDSRDGDGDAIAEVLEGHNRVNDISTTLTRTLILAIEGNRRAQAFGAGSADVDPPTYIEELLSPAMNELDAIASNAGVPIGVRTGFVDIDAVLGGLRSGTLSVVAARPGVGRSTLVLDFARTAAIRDGDPSAFFSFESSRDMLVHRMVSAEARLRLTDMLSGRMTDDDWTRMANQLNRISDAPIMISAGPSPDLDALHAMIAETVSEEQAKLVVVDSLNMVVARRFADTREREVAEIVRRLKAIAMDLDVALVATAEIARSADQRPGYRPVLADLRDADVISQVADVVILLHRPDAYERDDLRAGEADVIIAKNRYGPTNTITVAHQLHYSRFADLAH